MADVRVSKVDKKDDSGLRTIEYTHEDFYPITGSTNRINAQVIEADAKFRRIDVEVATLGVYGASITSATSSDPIETHPKLIAGTTTEDFTKLRMWEKDPNDPQLNKWTPALLPAGTPQKWIYDFQNKGVTEFLQPKITLKIKAIENAPPDLSSLGYVTTPPNVGDINVVEDIGLPEGTTWLMTGCEGVAKAMTGSGGDLEAVKFFNSYEYTASGPTGWDSFLYTP